SLETQNSKQQTPKKGRLIHLTQVAKSLAQTTYPCLPQPTMNYPISKSTPKTLTVQWINPKIKLNQRNEIVPSTVCQLHD
ncbi:hypothetical protein GIB67_041547, partial [Kingdonia uniflora]